MPYEADIRNVFWQDFSATKQDGILKEQKCYASVTNTSESRFVEVNIGIVAKSNNQLLAQKTYLLAPSESRNIHCFYEGGSWDDRINIYAKPYIEIQISSVYKDIDYVPDKVKKESANYASSAKLTIGDIVSADATLIRDDASGTYTGTPNAVITRPSHCIRHAIIERFGFSASEVDASSFSTAATKHISDDLLFDFASPFDLSQKDVRPSEFLKGLAKQCRSVLSWKGSKWYLDYLTDEVPAAEKTIEKEELVEGTMFIFEKTSRNDIANHIETYYGYNYTREKIEGSENEWRKELSKTDSTSIGDYGERKEELPLWAIEDEDTADAITTFQLSQRKNQYLIVSFTVFFEHFDLVQGDTFDIGNLLYGGTKFFIERVERQGKETKAIVGRSWLPISQI